MNILSVRRGGSRAGSAKLLCVTAAALVLLSACGAEAIYIPEAAVTPVAEEQTAAPETKAVMASFSVQTTEEPPEEVTVSEAVREPVTVTFSGKDPGELIRDTRKRDACGGYEYEYPISSGNITVLGANLVYVGESFGFDCVYTTVSPEQMLEWSVDSGCGSITPEGVFTALDVGVCYVTAYCPADGISSSMKVHCIRPGDVIGFIPMVNNIPIANKTYPLPEDYEPGLQSVAEEALDRLKAAAKADGILLEPVSLFRSFERQKEVYDSWFVQYGREETDNISARPGHSEHQLGLAADINSLQYEFADTKEGIWLREHCHEYGFILRYPSFEAKEYTGYNFEPWHIRYIGEELAPRVTETGKTLEELLGIDSRYR